MGSGLRMSFDILHPAHGKLTSLRVLCVPLVALFTLGFPKAPGSSPLAIRGTHKLAGSFFNRHAVVVKDHIDSL
jgi:hypothetical protein